MLTRFADFEGGASALQKALLTGTTFTAEQLSLLLQVWYGMESARAAGQPACCAGERYLSPVILAQSLLIHHMVFRMHLVLEGRKGEHQQDS